MPTMAPTAALERDDVSSSRHPALPLCSSMIFFRKPAATFRDHALGRVVVLKEAAAVARRDRGVELAREAVLGPALRDLVDHDRVLVEGLAAAREILREALEDVRVHHALRPADFCLSSRTTGLFQTMPDAGWWCSCRRPRTWPNGPVFRVGEMHGGLVFRDLEVVASD